jgi:hypothetical protein
MGNYVKIESKMIKVEVVIMQMAIRIGGMLLCIYICIYYGIYMDVCIYMNMYKYIYIHTYL